MSFSLSLSPTLTLRTVPAPVAGVAPAVCRCFLILPLPRNLDFNPGLRGRIEVTAVQRAAVRPRSAHFLKGIQGGNRKGSAP